MYRRTQGQGPPVLLLPGGDGDADAADALVAVLAADRTVVTHDRRGLARSPVRDGEPVPDVATHADDAAALLRDVTDEPATVVGLSLGGLIGLELVTRHPGLVGTLVTHEAPTTQFLDEPGRTDARRAQLEIERLFRDEGPTAALRAFLGFVQLDPDDREDDVRLPWPGPDRVRNLGWFLEHDAPAAARHVLDAAALRTTATTIVPAAGETSRAAVPNLCAQALARHLGLARAVPFPGGHNAFVMRPRAFGRRLREVLRAPAEHMRP